MDLLHVAIGIEFNIFDRLIVISEGFECGKRFENLSDLDHCCNVHGIQWSVPTVASLKVISYRMSIK